MQAAQKTVIYKDVKEVVGDKQMLIPMIITPLIMMMVLPAVLMIGAKFGVSGINGMDIMLKRLSRQLLHLNSSQMIIEIGVNYIFPALFLLIPIMSSSIIAASSFVGEKERKTLETLLYTPINIKELFTAKIIGAIIPSYAVALLSVIVFGIIVNIGGWYYFGKLIFPNVKWVLLIIWVAPAVTVLGVFFMVMISAKADTFQEAQQSSVFIVLPVIFLLIGQATGLFFLNEFMLICIGSVIYCIDCILIKNAAKKFVLEKLI